MLPRNDIRQYDDLAGAWWDPKGPLAMLQWIARSRAQLVPNASRDGAVLVDLACGAGLLAPHVAGKGYMHAGVDLTESALRQAATCGVDVVQGDVMDLPFASESADVVCAGEIFEHVHDLGRAVSESCRVLKPGGLVVIDTLADTAFARFLAVTIAERIPGGAPRGIHDPSLFVSRHELVQAYARHGVELRLRGLRPSLLAWMAWRIGMRQHGWMIPTRFTGVLFQAWGRKHVCVR